MLHGQSYIIDDHDASCALRQDSEKEAGHAGGGGENPPVSGDCRCEKCRAGCVRRPGWFAPGEATKAAAELGLTLEEFFKQYLCVDFWCDSENGDVELLSPAWDVSKDRIAVSLRRAPLPWDPKTPMNGRRASAARGSISVNSTVVHRPPERNRMRLESKYEVQAAHRLTAGVPKGHPCRRLHGHRYNITVCIEGTVNPETGMVLEYAEIDKRVNSVLQFIDHRFINELGYEEAEPKDGVRMVPFTFKRGKLKRKFLPGFLDTECAQKVRENSTVEHLADWLHDELNRRFEDLEDLAIDFVRVEEDGGHTVEV